MSRKEFSAGEEMTADKLNKAIIAGSYDAGETINGATLPVPVYQNTTDNEFYACDADDTAKLNFVGFAISNVLEKEVCDSYSESNGNTFANLYSGSTIKAGQTFTGDGKILNSCKFYLTKYGSPTGNMVAKLYAMTGTYGDNGKPTGIALATSEILDASTLTTSLALVTFDFIGANQYTLVDGTYYCIVLEYSGGDSDNKVQIGLDNSSPSHDGNYTQYVTWWGGINSIDVCFYVYTQDPIDIQFNGIVRGFTGLEAGKKYYVQNTAGTIGTSVGSNTVLVGIAISETELLIDRGW